MFYGHFVLAKKGPLARIWLAAHWDKKLTKAHIFETNIESSVEGILQPKVKLALRTSGHLLLGIVRIYSRKAKYLLADCNEAFIKIKMAFRPGVVDLPEENRQAEVATITLPEVFHDFDTAMTDINLDMGPQTLNQSRVEDITIKEDFGPLNVIEEDFGMSFDDTEMFGTTSNITDFGAPIAEPMNEEGAEATDKEDAATKKGEEEQADIPSEEQPEANNNNNKTNQLEATLTHDGFGGPLGQGIIDPIAGDFLDAAGLFDEAPLGPPDPAQVQASSQAENKAPDESDDDDDDDYAGDMGPPSFGAPSPPSSPESSPQMEAAPPQQPLPSETILPPAAPITAAAANIPPEPPIPAAAADQTTLIHNGEESFALAPLDTTLPPGPAGTGEKAGANRTKRKRKLIVDEVKNISGEEMKSQLSDTTDIVTTLDLAPPTKRLMHWKETGGVEKLFALPGKPILSKTLSRLYQRHLTTKSVENEETVLELDVELEKSPKPARKKHKADHLQPTLTSTQQQQQPHFPPIEAPSIQFPPMEPNIPPLPMDSYADNSQHALGARSLNTTGLNSIEVQRSLEASTLLDAANDAHASLHQGLSQQDANETLANPGLMETDLSLHSQGYPIPPTPHLVPPPPETMGASQPLPPQSIEDSFFQSAQQQRTFQEIPAEASFFGQPQPSEDLFRNQQQDPQQDSQPQQEPPQQQPLQDPQEDEATLLDPLLADLKEQQQFLEDDDDDYAPPPSIGPPEEQLADETDEQFEERILTKRTTSMVHILSSQLDSAGTANFSHFLRHHNRKMVAQKFYTLLVLKKQHILELEQTDPYGDLIITKGDKYHLPN